ncbi:MAG: RecQ family ATP-dependent DNA helicase [Leptolyngbyaceae bacterium]|nr:RecQ family ATP-dependent DNA helicase [Leptolyngbyaceae bacterium]
MHQTTPPSNPASWQHIQTALKQIWGYDSFRPPQGEIIRSLLQGTDTLVVMPTGGGKSICFQLPALLQRGLTIVVSPLIALMENQVRDLQQRRLPAALLHSQLDKRERSRLFWQIDQQRLRLLYVSPETLLSPLLWQQLNQPHVLINGLILDEAHCLVQWGDTFRPPYRRLGQVREALLKTQPNGEPIAIAAFTATADPQAQSTIESVLNLQNPQRILLNPLRQNLTLTVQTVWTPRGRRSRLHQWLQSHPNQSGLIYVRTRRQTEEISDWLNQLGYNTAAYHAGMGATQRRQVEANWLGDSIPIVICTSAFGMGIDKPNCRWVVQMQAPSFLSEYVQEVGRAGRDGKGAIALTLVSEPTGWLDDQDQRQRQFLHAQQHKSWQEAQQLIKKLPQNGDIQTISRQFKHGAVTLSLLHITGQLTWLDPFRYKIHLNPRLKPPTFNPAMKTMQQFLHTRQCRWQFILSAFGFKTAGQELGRKGCGRCDRCLPHP